MPFEYAPNYLLTNIAQKNLQGVGKCDIMNVSANIYRICKGVCEHSFLVQKSYKNFSLWGEDKKIIKKINLGVDCIQ